MKTQQNPYETGQALASVPPIQSKRSVTTGLIIGLVVTCVLLATFLLSVVFLFSGPDFSGRRRSMPIQKGFPFTNRKYAFTLSDHTIEDLLKILLLGIEECDLRSGQDRVKFLQQS